MSLRRTQLLETLSQEICRKLDLADLACTTDDSEVVCSEVFHDICGRVDDTAQEALEVPQQTAFYEVLAPFYAQNQDATRELLERCQCLMGQEYISPIFALLLHLYLLKAGAAVVKFQSRMNILVLGADRAFSLDIRSCTVRFRKLHSNLLRQLVASPPSSAAARRMYDPIIKLVATYMPYYMPPSGVMRGLLSLPPLSTASQHQEHVPDYMVKAISNKLAQIPSVGGLVLYLDGLKAVVQSLESWDLISEVPKAQLQNQLYFLSLPGGPRYCPVEVRQRAINLLGHVAPQGSWLRSFLRRCARLAQPKDWPHLFVVWIRSMYASMWALVFFCFAWLRRCFGVAQRR